MNIIFLNNASLLGLRYIYGLSILVEWFGTLAKIVTNHMAKDQRH